MEDFQHCFLTGLPLRNNVNWLPSTPLEFSYEFHPVGKVKITRIAAMVIVNRGDFGHPILASLCRAAFEEGYEPQLIDSALLQRENTLRYPKTFKEKLRHFLKLLYNTGGRDFKPRELYSATDFTLAYCVDYTEFVNFISVCHSHGYLQWHSLVTIGHGHCKWHDVVLTEKGIKEVERELPQIPMHDLVSQEISLGNKETDLKINHAKKLFFEEPQKIDNMRSACETLSFILEPLREEIKKYLIAKDVDDFFIIVNKFDIRHNKEHTKKFVYPEQFEWLFYSLLNSINTYSKLKKRFTSI